MAKAKIVLALLVTAKALLEVNENENLKKAIDELDVLEDATHSTTEYKNLKAIVDELESNTGDDKLNKGENQDNLDSNKDNEKEDDESNTGDDIIEEKPKKLNYVGIKMIGNKWYSMKDSYKKSFATADECAKHFN
ncbi:MAG: hypothetical protein RBR93_08620 [Aliarcobacter butzleri]|nr:hypothetical protein [Aliarcobacter butzleri]